MLHGYNDIIDRIDEEPKWWDERGVPRYCEFKPNVVANIYAKEVVFLLIACQSCRHTFKVAMSCSSMTLVLDGFPLKDQVKNQSIHYGDPPNTGCCPGGATMNCDDLKVLEFWHQLKMEWERVPELEGDLPDMPGYEDDDD